jgi:hypothetical protein
MVFSTSRTAETVTEFNYLGVTFTKNGKFKLAKQKNIEKATKAMINRGIDIFDQLV